MMAKLSWCRDTAKEFKKKAKNKLGGGSKSYEIVGDDSSSESESDESVSLDGTSQEEIQQRKADKQGVALDQKTNQEKYAKHLRKGDVDRDVALETETPETDSEGNINLDEKGVVDPSLVTWTIYTIRIPAQKLNSWANVGFDKDLELPMVVSLAAGIYKKLTKDANWMSKVTTLAEKEAADFIASVKDVIITSGEDVSFDDLEQSLQPHVNAIEAEVIQIIESYKQTKEELRHFQSKTGMDIGWNAGKATFHIAHSAATMGATAPIGFVGAGRNLSAALQGIGRVSSNPGTVAIEIDAGFKAIEKVKKETGTVGTALMQVAVAGFTLMGNKTLPLNHKQLKKKIEVDHRMAISALVTANHRIGKLLAQDAALEQMYHSEIETQEEAKFNKVKRMFPQLLAKQRARLQELSNSYETRIAKHNQLNAYFVDRLANLAKSNWEYATDIGEAAEKLDSAQDIYDHFNEGINQIAELLGNL